MGRNAGGRSIPAAVVVSGVLCLYLGSSYALVPKQTGIMQHQHRRCGAGRALWPIGDKDQERYRPRMLGGQVPASVRPLPLARDQHHQQPRRAVAPLGTLDAAVAFSETSEEKRDDGSSSSSSSSSSTSTATRISEAPPAASRESRAVGGDSVRDKEGGKRRRPRSIRKFFRRKSSDVLSYLTIMTTWLLFRFLLKGLNKVECNNRQALLDAVLDRGDRGLLTVSNHMCVYDDPGLWSALLPFWRTGRKKMRWALCTDDIYNANPVLKSVFKAGRTMPIRRTRGMEQPLFNDFFQKLEQGEWGHIFAEGAIRQPWRFSGGEPILGDFKAGIGRLLLRSENPPMVLPMYHIGMHQVASETPIHKRGRGKLVKIMPNHGRTVRVYVGSPIDVAPIIEKCRERIGDVRSLPWTKRSTMDEVACHREIAAYVREHVLKLEEVARRDYYGTDPDVSPYGAAPA